MEALEAKVTRLQKELDYVVKYMGDRIEKPIGNLQDRVEKLEFEAAKTRNSQGGGGKRLRGKTHKRR